MKKQSETLPNRKLQQLNNTLRIIRNSRNRLSKRGKKVSSSSFSSRPKIFTIWIEDQHNFASFWRRRRQSMCLQRHNLIDQGFAVEPRESDFVSLGEEWKLIEGQ